MIVQYIITIDQPVEGDASDCIVNAIECVDDDHWRGREANVKVERIVSDEEKRQAQYEAVAARDARRLAYYKARTEANQRAFDERNNHAG